MNEILVVLCLAVAAIGITFVVIVHFLCKELDDITATMNKEVALRQKEINSLRSEMIEIQLALYGRCGYDGKSFCGIPVVDPKNKPWLAYKWTFGDEHGTHS